MKSKFITRQHLSNSLKRRIKTYCQLSADSRLAIEEYIKSLTGFPLLTSLQIESIANKAGLSAEQARDGFLAATSLASSMAKFGDPPRAIADDLKDLEIITAEEADILISSFESLKEKAPQIQLQLNKNSAAYEGAPVLLRASMTVALKPVFEERYLYDKQPVTEYKPNIVEFVPVAQIEILIEDSGGNETSKAFQVSEQVLDIFISDLFALQVEMGVIKQRFDLNK